jgi:hypothetical protein
MKIYHQDLTPLVAPNRQCQLTSDAVLVRYNNEHSIVQEIYKRSNGTFGFRYQAWVNYADASGRPHHGWGDFLPKSNAVVDTIEMAKQLAEINANESETLLGQWVAT